MAETPDGSANETAATFQSLNLSGDIPTSLFQILDRIRGLYAGAPEIFDSVPDVKIHVFGDSDALNPRGMSIVMRGMVYDVGHAAALPSIQVDPSGMA